MTRRQKRRAAEAAARQSLVDPVTGTVATVPEPHSLHIVRESPPRSRIDGEDVLDRRHTGVTYSRGFSNPFTSFYNGTTLNPDPVVRKFGSWEDVAIYKGMWRRHPWLVGICDQRVEKADRPRVIVPGDPSDARSVELATAARRHWRLVGEKPTVTARWLKYARFLGYGGVEKVFQRDHNSGLIYGAKLIARESENIRAREDGTALWLSSAGSIDGEVIPQRKMMFMRGGTNDTFYGESELQHVYPVTYWLEKSIELAFDSIEEFGRAIPLIHMPRMKELLSEDERAKIRAWAAGYNRSYLEVPTEDTKVSVEMLGANIATSGAVGRPELSLVELCITWAYIRILRVVQTLNKTGGSRALETTRVEITDDASRPDCILIDDALNARAILPTDYTGWMADFCDINFPDEPDEILPRFSTPVMAFEEIQGRHQMAMELLEHGAKPSKQWYFKITGIEEALDDEDTLSGAPQAEPEPVADMPVASMPIDDMKEADDGP